MSPKPYSRKQTEVVGRYPFFEVERHDVESEGGEERFSAFTMRFPDWVAVAAMRDDGSFVLVRQYRHGVDATTLETPGGVIDPGEAPESAARRELREETGFEARSLESLGYVFPNAALQGNRCFLFLARGVHRVGETDCDEHESTTPVVMTLAEVEEALATSAIAHAPAVIALERAMARERNR